MLKRAGCLSARLRAKNDNVLRGFSADGRRAQSEAKQKQHRRERGARVRRLLGLVQRWRFVFPKSKEQV